MTRKPIAHDTLALALISLLLLACASCTATKPGPIELGIQNFEAQEYDTARTLFETALTKEPENPQAVYYLGRIALQSGDLDGAIVRLEQAVALDDANSEYHFRLGVAYSRKIQKAPMMEKGALAPKLKTEFERAVETDSSNVEARMALAQYYLNAPPMVGGSPEKAMAQVDAIKKLDPREGYLFMAQIHTGKKDYDAADKELQAALDLNPEDTGAHFQRAMLYQTKKDYATAFEAFEKTVAIDPGYMRAMYQIGRTAIFSGDNLERGAECLGIYLKNKPGRGQPSWAHAHWRLGMVYEKMGKNEMAKKEYQAALDLNPDIKEAREALERL
jgi:tetratricopeptide (TPR) repeat protein